MRFQVKTHPFALIRSPLLSIEALLNQLPLTHEEASTHLWNWLQKPKIRQALQVASPGLYQIGLRWKEQPTLLPTEEARLALWRYVFRMHSRSTPFGLFAGVSKAVMGAKTIGEVDKDEYKVAVRPDSAWMSALVEQLVAQPDIRPELRYNVNNSLYRLGNQFRYSDYRMQAGQRAFYLNSVAGDEVIEGILTHVRSQSAGVTGRDLVSLLTSTGQERPATAQALVDELIDAHILISELEPPVTGENMLGWFLEKLTTVRTAQTWTSTLAMVQKQLRKASASGAVDAHTQQIMRMLVREAYDGQVVCQVDLLRPKEPIAFKQSMVQQIGRELGQLAALRSDTENTTLTSFARRFHDRYGIQAQPLLLGLDHEAGVGYGSSGPRAGQMALLQALSEPTDAPTLSADRLDALRLAKLTNFLNTGLINQSITEDDVTEANHSSPSKPLARSWAVLGELYGTDTTDIDAGDYQFLVKSVSGPSGASLMARFGGHDEELTQQLRQLTDWEARQYPDALLAEIAHWPAGRVGNVLHRPTLRTYEIPYVTPSSVDPQHTLWLDDLWVRSLDGKTVELWSKHHNRRVLPRNTTAHNYHGSDDVYRFLTDLSHQDEGFSFRWSWGSLAQQPRLPRLVYKHLILARAQWNLTKDTRWTSAETMVDDLQYRLSLPHLIALVEGDHELLLDLNSPSCQQLLWAELNKRATVRVIEWLGNPERYWLSRSGQRYSSEVVLPFGVEQPAIPSHPSPFYADTPTVQRSFGPGSEWLYVKVYTGELTANDILTLVVSPLVRKATGQGWMDSWFFIRYYDPEPHLRLRFHGSEATYPLILNELNQRLTPWLRDGLVHSVKLDTYDRELERYGHATMPLVEQLFWRDSAWNLWWIKQREELHEDLHWWVACQRANELLKEFGLSIHEKRTLMTQLQADFLKENQNRKTLRRELNQHYRDWQVRLEQHTLPTIRSSNLLQIVSAIRSQEVANRLLLHELLRSLLHMQFNRFFVSSQRMSEGVVYHFLLRGLMAESALVITD